MKTNQLIGTMMGAALLSGAAWAQAEAPEGPGPRGEERGFRPDGERRERMEMRERGEMRGPMMRERGEMRGPMARGGMGEFPHGNMSRGPMAREPGEFPRGEAPRGPMMREEGECPRGDMPRCPMMRGRDGEGCEPRGARGPGEGAGQHGFLNPEKLKAAGATDKQLEAIKALADEQQMKRIDLAAAVEKAELTLNKLLGAETPDTAAALKAVDALSQARAELTKLEIGTRLKIRETLGAEVQKKLRELRPPEGARRPCACAEGQPPAPQAPAPAAERAPGA